MDSCCWSVHLSSPGWLRAGYQKVSRVSKKSSASSRDGLRVASSERSMFPTWPFMLLVTGLAAAIASASEFSGRRGFASKFVVSLLVVYGLVAAGVLLGLVLHSALFD